MKRKPQISCAVTVQLISAFVFATWKVQSLFYLNPKFQASSLQPGLCRTWLENTKTGFLTTRPITEKPVAALARQRSSEGTRSYMQVIDLGDNCIQYFFHLGRYIVRYMVVNFVLRRHICGAIKHYCRLYIRRYTSPYENFE